MVSKHGEPLPFCTKSLTKVIQIGFGRVVIPVDKRRCGVDSTSLQRRAQWCVVLFHGERDATSLNDSHNTECWHNAVNAGSTSPTLSQHYDSSGSMTSVVPIKHETLTQCCFNVGPPSSTSAQH